MLNAQEVILYINALYKMDKKNRIRPLTTNPDPDPTDRYNSRYNSDINSLLFFGLQILKECD